MTETANRLTDDPKEIMAAARVAVRLHLPEIARELLTWRDTAILPNGRLREIAGPLRQFSDHDALRIAEGLARDAALEVVANG